MRHTHSGGGKTVPESVLFSDGHEMRYTYAADGRKLRKEYRLNNIAIIEADKAKGKASTLALDEAVVAPGIGELPAEPAVTTLMTRDYCGSHIYRNGKLERTLTDGGYIQDGKHYFYIKDNQGNVRAVLNQQNQPVELTSYYPYGGIMEATSTEGVQPHKYGTKELDRENGLDWYDSRARYYDSPLGRTPTQDPKAESYPSITPYLWCAANPIRLTDPDGCVVKFDNTSMTDAQYQSLIDILNLAKQSTVFNRFYSRLENNPDFIVTIKYGETISQNNSESVDAQYTPENQQITLRKGFEPTLLQVVEELHHATLDMDNALVGADYNVEFEAKTVASIVAGDAEGPKIDMKNGISPLYNDGLYFSAMEFLKAVRKYIEENYVKFGSLFSRHWKMPNNYNFQYSKPVENIPESLKILLR